MQGDQDPEREMPAGGFSAEYLEDVEATLSNRERYIVEEAIERLEGPRLEGPALTGPEAMAAISNDAYELIVNCETGGRAYYETVIKAKPEWPGDSSGVTIGFGYDLGYNTREQFTATWKPLLGQSDFERLAPATGFRTVEPNRADKVVQAKRYIRQFSDIIVPWGLGETVFQSESVPRFLDLAHRSLPSLLELHPHCVGTILSLVFNRGASFSLAGDRYREMRAIKQLMDQRSYAGVPDQIRSMARLWTSTGLKQRRKDEAALFERGLKALPVPQVVASAGGAAIESVQYESVPEARFGRAEEGLPPEDDRLPPGMETVEVESPAYGGQRYDLGDVAWAKDDNKCPDFRHLVGITQAQSFSFNADDLEFLIASNRFQPTRQNGKILFGLRGAELKTGAQQANASALELLRARPDHKKFHCVIGVYDIASKTLSGFRASTVPNAKAVLTCWRMAAAGSADGELQGNMLPTGCYPYAVGTHRGSSREVPGAFLQGISDAQRARITVLRSKDDVTYTVNDFWQVCIPNDNIHCAFSTETFSSFGCQTVMGTCENGTHTGPWQEFRKAVGLSAHAAPAENDRRFDYVLVTGLDAACASEARTKPGPDDQAALRERFVRLRHGSQGDEVKRLQAGLSIAQDGIFDHKVRKALVQLQNQRIGFSDGIYSPEMDKLLALNVFGAGPAVVAMAARAPGSQRPATMIESVAPRAPQAAAANIWKTPRGFQHIEAVLAADDENALYRQLGALTQEAIRNPASTGNLELVTVEAPALEGVGDVLAEIGQRVYGRLEDELYRMLCGTDSEDSADRDRVRDALKQVGGVGDVAARNGKEGGGQGAHDKSAGVGMTELITAIASVLMGSAGVWYGPALVVAGLFARRIAKATLEETCVVWGQNRRGPRVASGGVKQAG